MADFHVRSDSVDVEQIMRQIRARIQEKRGADYTEAELQQLASVKLEKFLDPRGLRSDLVEQFRKHRTVSPEPPKFVFEDTTLYETHRGALRFMRKLLHPFLKLLFNPNPLIHAMHVQAQANAEFHRRFRQREEMDPLYYEVIHNLVIEVTRLGIEVHNLKMRAESLGSRMDFDERRGRALESVVQYRGGGRPQGGSQRNPPVQTQSPSQQLATQAPQVAPVSGQPAYGTPATGTPMAGTAGTMGTAGTAGTSGTSGTPGTPGTPGTAGNSGGRGGQPQEGRGDGTGRRRRRRRRRRPGQTQGDRQGWGQGPGGAGTQNAELQTSNGQNDDVDDGPDEDDNSEPGGQSAEDSPGPNKGSQGPGEAQ